MARNPTYELRIWRAEDYLPAELVYARSGLTEPVHTVETPFAPDTLYLWTIRARFELNGELRVMEWGGRLDGLKTAKVWPPGYYMFMIPSRLPPRSIGSRTTLLLDFGRWAGGM